MEECVITKREKVQSDSQRAVNTVEISVVWSGAYAQLFLHVILTDTTRLKKINYEG